jgi:putative copper resistance protein D
MDNFLLLPRTLTAAAFDIAFAGAIGLVIADLWSELDPKEKLCRKLRNARRFCSIAMLIALPIQAWLLSATMTGSSSSREIRSQLVLVLTGTHAGRVLLCSFAFALIFFFLLLLCPGKRAGTQWLIVALFGLAATRAATGHAAADGDFALPEWVQLVHLVSIAIWAGSVMAAGFIVLPSMLRDQLTDPIGKFTRKLSRNVTIALVLIVLSGIYNSYRGLGGSLTPLVQTQWGCLLDIKIALVLAAVAMGGSSRRMLQRNRILSLRQVSSLTVVLRIEAIVMLLILIVSACLANSPPANSF